MKTLRLLTLFLLFSPLAQADEPVLLVTIKPLAWLAQALAPAGANVQTLIPDGQSPHDYQLRPADAARLQHSALLLWVGPGLEPWLNQIVERLPADRQFALLPHSVHEHGKHDHEEHDHAEHGHDEHAQTAEVSNTDPHIWLDPLALREQSVAIANAMSKIYPAKKEEINQRLAQFQEEMLVLDKDIAARFSPVAQSGFVVYHDGYQRLVKHYHLNQRAAVWQHESIPAGAKERARLLALLNSGDVQCLFYEPEHGRDAVNSWLGSAGLKVKMVELDILGQHITDGADAYPRFMQDISGKMTGCLLKNN